jgi:hypothetical protein
MQLEKLPNYNPKEAERKRSLDELRKEANEHYELAESYANKTIEFRNEAVKEAILCGQALNEAKKLVPFGGWLIWLRKNCSQMCQSRAYNYMGLATKFHHDGNLAEAAGLRQALIAIGALVDPEAKERGEASNSINAVPARLEKLCLIPVEQMTAKQKEQVKKLKPFGEAIVKANQCIEENEKAISV